MFASLAVGGIAVNVAGTVCPLVHEYVSRPSPFWDLQDGRAGSTGPRQLAATRVDVAHALVDGLAVIVIADVDAKVPQVVPTGVEPEFLPGWPAIPVVDAGA